MSGAYVNFGELYGVSSGGSWTISLPAPTALVAQASLSTAVYEGWDGTPVYTGIWIASVLYYDGDPSDESKWIDEPVFATASASSVTFGLSVEALAFEERVGASGAAAFLLITLP